MSPDHQLAELNEFYRVSRGDGYRKPWIVIRHWTARSGQRASREVASFWTRSAALRFVEHVSGRGAA